MNFLEINKTMVIGIANNLLGKYGRGSGAEVIAEKMANNFRAQGHQVFIITTKKRSDKNADENDYYYLNSNYSQLKNWSEIKKLFWHAGQLFWPGHCRQIKKILTERKPELFITHNLVGLGNCLPRLLKKYKIRHEHVLHDIQLLHPSGLMYWGEESIINTWPAKIYQYFTQRILNSAALIISPSRWLLEIHLQQGFFKKQEKIIKPNFNLIKKIPDPLNKPIQFVFTGQIEKHKGVEILFEAWRRASLSPDQAQLTFAGDGSLSSWLKEEQKKFKNVDYAGYLDRSGINELLKKTDVVLAPSLVYENSPTSLWEAAEHGLRAIASNIGGIPELSPYLELKLVPPNNSEALAETIKTMIKE